MNRVEAVIFDWAGTTVDYGCMAPIFAMQSAFRERDMEITLDEIRKPMGMLKIDHIKALLEMPRIQQSFKQLHGREYTQHDVEGVYDHFEKSIFKILDQHTTVIDGLLTTQAYLKEHGIKIGSTSGYTKAMLEIVASSAKSQGYEPDHMISSDEVSRGRPYPYMIYQNMDVLQIKNIRSVIKVGDTIVDIEEGKNAGCLSVGVVLGSSMLGLSQEEANNMDKDQLSHKAKQVRYDMLAAGADYVIDSLHELPALIAVINQR